MSTGAKKKWVDVGAGLLAVLAGLMVWLGSADKPFGEAPAPVASDGVSAEGGQKAPPAPAPSPVTKGPPPEDMLREVPCELDSLVEEYRQGKGSPAWRRYVM
ncbi:MAG TPA: hypothetical protein VEZ71_03230, partial [Archangium sp.]|nr:hypothetical protein [Archangium sp.]